MNTAFMDAQNLAWKIHAVESGFAHRDILNTYEVERKIIATALIKFDNPYANLYSTKPEYSDEQESTGERKPQTVAISDVYKPYGDSRAFVSGHGFRYEPSILTWSTEHTALSESFQVSSSLTPGQLFITADLIRVIDADRVHLEQVVPPNGSFRIVVFGGHPSDSFIGLQDLSNNLLKHSLFFTNTQNDAQHNPHYVKHNPHSKLYTFCIIFDAMRTDVNISKHIPGMFQSYKYHVYVDQDSRAHTKAGFHSENPGVAIVRPDGYVGAVLKLMPGSGTADALAQYFFEMRHPSRA